MTALMEASFLGNMEAVKLLLPKMSKRGINIKSSGGGTARAFAHNRHHSLIEAILIEAGSHL
jgi:ankyrin repeat protein